MLPELLGSVVEIAIERMPVLGLRVADTEDVVDEINVAPEQRLQLDAADPGQDERQEDRPAPARR